MKKHRKKQKKRVHMECRIFYYHVISVINMIIAIYFGDLEKARLNNVRLTKVLADGRIIGNDGRAPCRTCDEMLHRLAQYESSDLTPERIRELQNAFNILFESERQKVNVRIISSTSDKESKR